MKDNLRGTVWRLAVFFVACGFGIFALFAVFSELRFLPENTYTAEFDNVTGLEMGQFVRIAGVEVGKVKRISMRDNAVSVELSVDDSVVLTKGSRAVIRYDDLIGGRYVSLEEGVGSLERLYPGGTIPIERTSPALDLDALIGGFRPLFRALDPDQVNELTGQLVEAFQGQGDTFGSFFTQTAALTNTLADRDQLIGEVIVNLHTVLGSVGDQSGQFAKAVDSLSTLLATLSDRKEDISNSIAYTNAAAGSITALLAEARAPLTKVVHETDRAAGLVLADHEYVDDLLKTLPDAYQRLSRQGLYGDFFSFYLCDAVLKLNGKGGNPVYVKVIGQDTGRCTPR